MTLAFLAISVLVSAVGQTEAPPPITVNRPLLTVVTPAHAAAPSDAPPRSAEPLRARDAAFSVTDDEGRHVSLTAPGAVSLSNGEATIPVLAVTTFTGRQTLTRALGTDAALEIRIPDLKSAASRLPADAYTGTIRVSATYD